MKRATLTTRVEALEHAAAAQASLPARVDGIDRKLDEFRDETRRELAAVRREMADGFPATRAELRQEIRAGDEAIRTRMLMLHEDVIARIQLIGEGIDDLRRR